MGAQESTATGDSVRRSLYEPVGTMGELMAKIVLPASDAILYISSRTPQDDAQWERLQGQALMLAETASLLMLPERSLDQEQWIADSRLMLEAGKAAYTAALDRDLEALAALNEPLYASCEVCHEHYEVNTGGR